jgi:hypothetical protein
LWSSIALRGSAAIGSPCEPVVMQTTAAGGWLRTSASRICTPAGILIRDSLVMSYPALDVI